MSILQKNKKRILKYRLTLILPYLITAIVLIPLIFIEKRDALVQIELSVRNVSFNFIRSEGGPLFSILSTKVAQFTHFEKFTLPFTNAEIATEFDEANLKPVGWAKASINGKMTVIPSNNFSSIIFENILLNELILQKETRVTLTVSKEEESIVKIAVYDLPCQGKILIGDTLEVECQYCKIDGIEDKSESGLKHVRIFNTTSHEVDFRSHKNFLLICIELQKITNLSERNIYIENISFLEGSGRYLRTSIVKPGKIIFKHLNNKEINIESHDFVEIGESDNLQIMRMTFGKGEIGLVLIGRVDKLKTGTKEFLTSRLPSVLEWIYNKQPLILYLNTLVLVATTIIAILQRLKISP